MSTEDKGKEVGKGEGEGGEKGRDIEGKGEYV